MKNEVIINADFEQFLENYIKKNPIPKYLALKGQGKFATPSYQLYFWKKGLDSIVQVRLNPFVFHFNQLNSSISKDENEIIVKENPEGYFKFRQNLIVVFDKNNYGINILHRNKLINKIPDSLEWDFDKQNNHFKNKSSYFNISKNKEEINK
ncbi:hypothetical protein [Polaribacter septentrionalilitoris]|uniref:hypothetical protein n=1 Tax=Polaribacter septentrionalilitoris TaxID=2494657 RepID=UPI00135912E6|nr:hypothetical protein [Polaribacter septentrionalilitoris]